MKLNTVKNVRENLNCYIVGEVFKQSLEIARAVELANELGLEVTWEYEQDEGLELIAKAKGELK